MRKAARILLPLLFWLAVWQAAATVLGMVNARGAGQTLSLAEALVRGQELLLPAPLSVGERLAELAVTQKFWKSVALSLGRIFAGLAGGVALGTALAALTSASRAAELLLSPAIRTIRATPVASFIVLVLLWVKTGQVPGVISGLMVLPVVWENVRQGIGKTDRALLEFGRAYGFGWRKIFRLIYLPSVLPHFTSGAVNGLGLAWKSGVAAEVLCQPRWAIGSEVYRARTSLDTPALFAWTAVVVLLSLLLERALVALLRRLEGRRVQ